MTNFDNEESTKVKTYVIGVCTGFVACANMVSVAFYVRPVLLALVINIVMTLAFLIIGIVIVAWEECS